MVCSASGRTRALLFCGETNCAFQLTLSEYGGRYGEGKLPSPGQFAQRGRSATYVTEFKMRFRLRGRGQAAAWRSGGDPSALRAGMVLRSAPCDCNQSSRSTWPYLQAKQSVTAECDHPYQVADAARPNRVQKAGQKKIQIDPKPAHSSLAHFRTFPKMSTAISSPGTARLNSQRSLA